MEIWGRCKDCSSWFYCSTAEAGGGWACPLCGGEPIAIENRARPSPAVHVGDLQPTGAGR